MSSTATFDFWQVLAGLGLFLFGMQQLEQALHHLGGRAFKLSLRRYVSNGPTAVLSGVVATAMFQSSSVVGLIALAFAATGIITLGGALGIVFGANFGTTMTGWIVALLGFKLDLEAIAYPLVGLGGIAFIWSAKGSRFSRFTQLAMGLGLMLSGLDLMKSGAASVSNLFDPATINAYPPITFLIVGLVITSLIQSSSAMIMITLSALYAGVISLPSAAALAIGADLGTTATVLLGAMFGAAVKRQVAMGLVIFTLVTDLLAFAALGPLLVVVESWLGIEDPLYALVAFHSLFNLLGVFLFLPLINPISRMLQARISSRVSSAMRYIQRDDLKVPEAAVDSVGFEAKHFISKAIDLNLKMFDLAGEYRPNAEHRKSDQPGFFTPVADIDVEYAELKRLEGEILRFVLKLQAESLKPAEAEQLDQSITAIRNAVHSTKCIKDIQQDLHKFLDAANDPFHAYYQRFRELVDEYYKELPHVRDVDFEPLVFEYLVQIKAKNEALHDALHKDIYRTAGSGSISEVEISTVLNVNREIYTSNIGLLDAISNSVLKPGELRDFQSLPTGGGLRTG